MERVVVEAPASSANLGPGFDVFALALKEPRDRVEVRSAPSGRLRVRVEVEGGADLPTSPRENAAGAVVLSMAKKFGLEGEVAVRLTKGVPIGVGLGSSGASSAAAAVATERLFDLKMSVNELVAHAGEGERAASGAAHLDNVTAAIAGGFVMVQVGTRAPTRFSPPKSMAVVIATPRVELPARKTAFARSLLPAKVRLADAVHNVSRASMIVAGFANGDVQMIGEGMDDAVVEAARARMIPGFDAVKKAAKEAGAAGVCISGAGPSVLSIVDRKRADPGSVLEAEVRAFRSKGAGAEGFLTEAGEGAKVIEAP